MVAGEMAVVAGEMVVVVVAAAAAERLAEPAQAGGAPAEEPAADVLVPPTHAAQHGPPRAGLLFPPRRGYASRLRIT